METDWVILADRAEIINDKLYLMGGGWERLILNHPEMKHLFGIALAFSVPWNETNQTSKVELEITDDDSEKILAKVGAELEVGRPAGLKPGQSQRVQFALNLGVQFEKMGGHVVVVRVEGRESRRFPFVVEAGPALEAMKKK